MLRRRAGVDCDTGTAAANLAKLALKRSDLRTLSDHAGCHDPIDRRTLLMTDDRLRCWDHSDSLCCSTRARICLAAMTSSQTPRGPYADHTKARSCQEISISGLVRQRVSVALISSIPDATRPNLRALQTAAGGKR